MTLNFIDVFSGAGGLSCGLELAGMKCILGIDFNKHAIETFAANHPSADTYCGDISKLTNKKILEIVGDKKIHAVVGGPPCQGFSTVGPGNPLDQRNKLFMEFSRIVKQTSPDFIVIENVTGLIAQKNEKTLQAIFKHFKKMGYNLNIKVMSSQHFGVPEKRRRTIILGSKYSNTIIFPTPTHDTIIKKKYIPPRNVNDALKNLKDSKGNLFNHDLRSSIIKSKKDLKIIKYIPEGCGIRYKKDEINYLPSRIRLGINWSELPENRFRQTKYQRLNGKGPSPTIMTHRHSYYHPTENRFLTPREAASLQSFPNSFEFSGPITAQWRQIGNAVPPLLGKAIGTTLLKMHRKQKKLKSNNISNNVLTVKNINKLITEIRQKAFVY